MLTLFETEVSIRCKKCGATNIRKHGTYGIEQRWFCKSCHTTFTSTKIIEPVKSADNPNKDKLFCGLSESLQKCSQAKDIENKDSTIIGCNTCDNYSLCIEWWDSKVCDLASNHVLIETEFNQFIEEFKELGVLNECTKQNR